MDKDQPGKAIPSSDEIAEEAALATEKARRLRRIDKATLWAFTAMRLLRAAADRKETWALQFAGEINQELRNCVVDPDRLLDFIQQEADRSASMMEGS